MTQFLLGVLLGVIGMGIAMILGVERDGVKRVDTIVSAQKMEIGEGVTLSQGISAFFGDGSQWGSLDGDWAWALAGMSLPTAKLYACPKTGEIKIRKCEAGADWEDEQGREALLALMIQAAKAQKKDS